MDPEDKSSPFPRSSREPSSDFRHSATLPSGMHDKYPDRLGATASSYGTPHEVPPPFHQLESAEVVADPALLRQGTIAHGRGFSSGTRQHSEPSA